MIKNDPDYLRKFQIIRVRNTIFWFADVFV